MRMHVLEVFNNLYSFFHLPKLKMMVKPVPVLMRKVTYTSRIFRSYERRVFCYTKVNFRSRKKLIIFLPMYNIGPGFIGRLFLASCSLSLFILLPLHIAPFFSSSLWYFPQACLWHLLLNPKKPLHFPSNIICKIEENSPICRVKGVGSESQCISLTVEDS